MASASAVTLVRVTVRAPTRWIDVALPGDVAVAELLPYILRHAGDDTADAGERHAGWLLRRPTGDIIDSQRTLAAQRVLDGEVLHLVPGDLEWPELEYEDLVETIASGARRAGRSWGRSATRRCGLAIGAAILVSGLAIVPLFQPPWLVPGVALLAVGAVLLVAGTLLARALPDAHAGAVLAGCSLPYAFVGGLLVTAPDHAGLTDLGSRQLLLATVAVLLFGVAGFVGVTVAGRVFSAAIAVGALGAFGALVAGPLASDSAAALVLAVGIGLLPGYPLLAIRLGRLPLPTLPQRSADLFTEDPLPPQPEVFKAAARTDQILAGLLSGLAVASVVAAAFLAAAGCLTHQLMLGAAALALLLRARLFVVARQRIPLLVGGVVVAALLAWVRAIAAGDNTGLVVVLLVVVVIALGVVAAGLVYSRRAPSPYLGRISDILDVVAILALIPLTGLISGFFAYVQSLMAGLG